MSFPVSFRPQAVEELRSAQAWYEAQRVGLGREFEAETGRVVELLGRSPLLFPVTHGDIRRAVVRRFPYGLFFQVIKAEVVVLSCHHLRRRPRRWGRSSR